MAQDARRFVIGSHCSSLAQAEAHWVGKLLRLMRPQLKIEHAVVSKASPRARSLKELSASLRRNEIDVAVHGAGDLCLSAGADVILAAVPRRELPFDVLVAPEEIGLEDLPSGARVGACGVQRRGQLMAQRADLLVSETPPDPEAALASLERGELLALVMPGADLEWLGLAERVTEILMPSVCLPGPGQGALAVRARAEDPRARDIAGMIDNPVARAAVAAECACARALGRIPEAQACAYCEATEDDLSLEGLIISSDGRRFVRDTEEGGLADAEAIGSALGRRLLAEGGEEILRSASTGTLAAG